MTMIMVVAMVKVTSMVMDGARVRLSVRVIIRVGVSVGFKLKYHMSQSGLMYEKGMITDDARVLQS